MDQRVIIEIVQQTLMLIMQLSAPIMAVALIVGLAIALLQALTQIQEMTLAFVPKIIAVFFAIFLLFPMFTATLVDFMHMITDQIVSGDLRQGP
jgi:flagellar biosynthetic protein FliQ